MEHIQCIIYIQDDQMKKRTSNELNCSMVRKRFATTIFFNDNIKTSFKKKNNEIYDL